MEVPILCRILHISTFIFLYSFCFGSDTFHDFFQLYCTWISQNTWPQTHDTKWLFLPVLMSSGFYSCWAENHPVCWRSETSWKITHITFLEGRSFVKLCDVPWKIQQILWLSSAGILLPDSAIFQEFHAQWEPGVLLWVWLLFYVAFLTVCRFMLNFRKINK